MNHIRSSDVVLDIGAHVGGFSSIVTGTADKIYAAEPLYTKELLENIEINGSAMVFHATRNTVEEN